MPSLEIGSSSSFIGEAWIGYGINVRDVMAAAYRRIGLGIQIDKGDGVLSTVKASELGPSASLSGSLDGFGVRELSFSRFGSSQSPFKSSQLRAMRAVSMTGRRGIPGEMVDVPLFEGFVRDPAYRGFPPTADIRCQDTSLSVLDQPLFYNLDPGATVTRRQVIQEICGAYGITLGTVTLVDDGGIVFKGIDVAGDRSVGQFFVDFLLPTGARMYWRNGDLNIKRFTGTETPTRMLGAGDFREIRITPPMTNAPNVVTVSATVYDYVGSGGERIDANTLSAFTTYTPLVAINKQTAATGVISAVAPSTAAAYQEVSRIVTTTTRDANMRITAQTVETWGWYAPRAANRSQNAGGADSYNASFDVYQFADLSWRSIDTETFRVVEKSVLTRTYDGAGIETARDELVYKYRIVQIPTGYWDEGTGTRVYAVVLTGVSPYSSQGVSPLPPYEDFIVGLVAWSTGIEVFTNEHNVTVLTADATTNRVTRRAITVKSGARDVYQTTTIPVGPYSAPRKHTFGGITGVVIPRTLVGTDITIATVTTDFVSITTQSHEAITVIDPSGDFYPMSYQPVVVYSSPDWGVTNTITEGSVPGPPPLATGETVHQSEHTEKDNVRISYHAGGQEIVEYQENEYCQTEDELETLAFELIRELSAFHVEIVMAVDFSEFEGDTVAISHTELAHGPVSLLVNGFSMEFGGPMGGNTQTLDCRWYPPEVTA